MNHTTFFLFALLAFGCGASAGVQDTSSLPPSAEPSDDVATASLEGCPALEGPVVYREAYRSYGESACVGDPAVQRELRENGAWRSGQRTGCIADDEMAALRARVAAAPATVTATPPSQDDIYCDAEPTCWQLTVGDTTVEFVEHCDHRDQAFDPESAAVIEEITSALR
ncbi:MAG: hypothetical protein AAF938_11710 [Myxococcota bacterium]